MICIIWRKLPYNYIYFSDIPCSWNRKESACNAGNLGLIPKSGRSSGEENGNPLQYSCPGKSHGKRSWWATVRGFTESDTTEQLTLHILYTHTHMQTHTPIYAYKTKQLPQICRWHHPYSRKWRKMKDPLDVSERGEWKIWLKT